MPLSLNLQPARICDTCPYPRRPVCRGRARARRLAPCSRTCPLAWGVV